MRERMWVCTKGICESSNMSQLITLHFSPCLSGFRYVQQMCDVCRECTGHVYMFLTPYCSCIFSAYIYGVAIHNSLGTSYIIFP